MYIKNRITPSTEPVGTPAPFRHNLIYRHTKTPIKVDHQQNKKGALGKFRH